MSRLVVLSAAEQVANHLRDEVLRGTWSGRMPGGDRLALELGIGRDTVEAALKRLEDQGLLFNQGRRRGRLVTSPKNEKKTGLRMMILLYEDGDRALSYVIDLQHRLRELGHTADLARKTLMDLGRDVRRVEAFVGRQDADAWIVFAGSRDILEWFATRPEPAFALFGRRREVALAGAGPDKEAAMRAMVRRLVSLGHRRIIYLAREERRKPRPGAIERAYLDELNSCGIATSPYNLPDWEETIDGFDARLEALLRITPPTAMILDVAPLFVAARHFLGRHGLGVPEDVSLVCNDADPAFSWCKPPISHIRWDSGQVVKRIVQWASNISLGKTDLRQTLTPAEFVVGGTIGPAREK